MQYLDLWMYPCTPKVAKSPRGFRNELNIFEFRSFEERDNFLEQDHGEVASRQPFKITIDEYREIIRSEDYSLRFFKVAEDGAITEVPA